MALSTRVLLLALACVCGAWTVDGALAPSRDVVRQDDAPLQAPVNDYYLSDMSLAIVQSGYGEMERDRSNGEEDAFDGVDMAINGRKFEKGLGVHSTSVIVVALVDSECTSFSSFVGIDDETRGPKAIPGGPYGSVVFEVRVDGEVKFRSDVLYAGNDAVSTGDISVEGAKELMLIVEDGGDGFTKDHADWADAKLSCTAQPLGDPAKLRSKHGAWESTMAWPVKSIHASLIPGNDGAGVIITHASKKIGEIGDNDPDFPHDMTKVDKSEIQGSTFTHEWVDREGEEMYCSGHVVQGGGVLEFGGHGGQKDFIYFGKAQTSRFDLSTNSWTVLEPMAQPRWYPTALTLGNGEVLSIAGSHAAFNNYKPEVYSPSENTWRTLNGVDYEGLLVTEDKKIILDDTYPFCTLSSDGRVLWAGWDESMSFFSTEGEGSWGTRGQREESKRAWASPLLIRTDELLLVGGLDPKLNDAKAVKTVVRMKWEAGGEPNVSYAASMFLPRVDTQATILPDGTAFVNGGGNEHVLGASPTHIRAGEIYDPVSNSWSITATAGNPRGYHSTALLLPDGRVWTAGGECSDQPDGKDNCPSGKTAEVFLPPYLFNDDGFFAERPTITASPDKATKPTFEVESPSDVARITLVRVGSATHHMNFDQRFLELTFAKSEEDGQIYVVNAPENTNECPPGHYLLTVLDGNGTPSVSKFIEF